MWQIYYEMGYKQAQDNMQLPEPPKPPKQRAPTVQTPGTQAAQTTVAGALGAPSTTSSVAAAGHSAAQNHVINKHSGTLRRPLTNEDGYETDRTVSNGFKMVDLGPNNSDSANAENRAVMG